MTVALRRMWSIMFGTCLMAAPICAGEQVAAEGRDEVVAADVVVVGGTPAGITAAIAAAREGASVVLLERSDHIGGLPANGLGATDIKTRAATGGLFRDFVRRVRAHYERAHGPDSAAVRDCRDGYHFEPSVAEAVLEGMLAEYPGIVVRRRRQFDALPDRVTREPSRGRSNR